LALAVLKIKEENEPTTLKIKEANDPTTLITLGHYDIKN